MSDFKKSIAGLIPADWNSSLIKNVSNVVRGSSPRPAGDPKYFNGDYLPWVTVADVTKDNEIYLRKTKTKLTKEGAKKTRILEKGTLVLTNSGATLGVPKILEIKGGANDGIAVFFELNGIDKKFFYYFLQSQIRSFRERLAPGVGQPNLNTELIGAVALPLPIVQEQIEIAKIFGLIDGELGLLEKLVSKKEYFRKGLMQQLLFGKKRLSKFVKSNKTQKTKYGNIPLDWDYSQIKNISIDSSIKNKECKNLPVLSCTKHHGLVDSLQYFDKQIFSDDISPYKIVSRNQFAYATNHIEEGSIGYQDIYDDAVISPMYTVFETNKKIDDSYLFLLLKTEKYRRIFEANTTASVDRRGSLRWKDFSSIHIPLPCIEEQKAIANVFVLADKEIGLLKKQLEELKLQKKGLMQQLLTGKKRVKVKVKDVA